MKTFLMMLKALGSQSKTDPCFVFLREDEDLRLIAVTFVVDVMQSTKA
jgi:hypothetical protein